MQIPTVGIVAEYNPLHLGHHYHLAQARKFSQAEAVVVVLSSNFVQRGEPALLSKWDRAQAALDSGADLVLELPVVFSSHNAGVFANAAVDILGATGIVTHLSFGLESPDWQMDKILDILIEEPNRFKFSLKEHLGKGYSFVEARSLALDSIVPGCAEKMSKSNNSLALAYRMRIKQKNWNMESVPIQRIGAGYHDNEISEYSSATAVRKAIAQGKIDTAISQLNQPSAEIVKRALCEGRICYDYGKLWNILRPMFLNSTPEKISAFAEIIEGIEHLLRNKALESKTFEEWSSSCTSKRYPRGRIQRHGIHFLLGLEHWTNRSFQRLGPAYIRVLGTNNTGIKLLRLMRTKATLPVITRCGAVNSISTYAKIMMDFECLGAELWEQIIPNGKFGREHAHRVIIKGA